MRRVSRDTGDGGRSEDVLDCGCGVETLDPDDLAKTLGVDAARAALEAIVAELLFSAEISMGYAAQTLGIPYVDAVDWYAGLGHTYPSSSDDEIMDELRAPWPGSPPETPVMRPSRATLLVLDSGPIISLDRLVTGRTSEL